MTGYIQEDIDPEELAHRTELASAIAGSVRDLIDATVRTEVGETDIAEARRLIAAATEIAQTVIDGIRDESDHVQSMAANCPNTRMVLGGYSQGALVSGFTTSDVVPAMVPTAIAPRPMPPEVADHVAAVVLFGTPSAPFLERYGAPAITIGPRYADKTLQLCAQGDTICSGASDGGPTVAHALYPVNGMVTEGAAYAVGRL